MVDETLERNIILEIDEIQSSQTWRAALAVLSDPANKDLSPTVLADLIAKREMIVENNTRWGKLKIQIKPYLDKFFISATGLGIAGTGTFLYKFWDKLPQIIELLK